MTDPTMHYFTEADGTRVPLMADPATGEAQMSCHWSPSPPPPRPLTEAEKQHKAEGELAGHLWRVLAGRGSA